MTFDRKKKSIAQFFSANPHVRWAVLGLVLVIFATGLYPDLVIKKHRYSVGEVALTDIKASEAFFIEEPPRSKPRLTPVDKKRPAVYDRDPAVAAQTIARLNAAFDQLRSMGEATPLQSSTPAPHGSAPLPPSTGTPAKPDPTAGSNGQPRKARPTPTQDLFETLLGVEVDAATIATFAENGFSEEIPELVAAIVSQVLTTGVVADKKRLLKESKNGITLRDQQTDSETHVTQLKQFYGPQQAKTMVRIVGDPLLRQVSPDLRDAIVDLSRQLIRPNMVPNRQETAARRAAAATQGEPVRHMIKKGEMLVREGERITELQFRKIQAMQAQADTHRIPMAGIGAVALLAAILILQYHVRLESRINAPKFGNKDLFFLGSVMAVLMVVVNISTTLPDDWFLGLSSLRPSSTVGFGIPLAAGAMIVCLIMGLDIALIFSLTLALSATMLLQGSLETFIYFILSCTMASWWLQDCRERRVVIKAGARLGLLNALLAVIIDLYAGAAAWVTLPVDVTMAFLGGFGAGIIAAGMAPLVEWVFGYTTDITLLEQANLDRPILRRLMVEAPGTYHHSIIVGSMVEAAATAIGANPILAKVCGYYHDIGKLKQPLYFIENQSDGKNKHDKLAPSMSALILIAHVKNGVELARENNLGQVIIDSIEQHHGTSLISYFYAKAKAVKGENAVNIDDFRYPGPRPQTREAGLVMLADVLEAASRTLSNPTPSRINGLVRNLINNVFSDGQLDHCELTLKDLTLIADHFTKILNGIHHHRIEYQDSAANSSGKSRHANTDRKQPAPLQVAK